MKNILVAVGCVALVAAIVLFSKGLRTAPMPVDRGPRMVNLPDQHMLVVNAKGDPNQVAGKAYRELFRTYYHNASGPEKRARKAPRARWPAGIDSIGKGAWQGKYALPVAADFPAPKSGDMSLEDWSYGQVAEILHVGSYSSETEDIQKLKAWIAGKGLMITGDHEEEYLRGPGAFFKGNPKNYRTLIRYRVAKAPETEKK